MTPSERKIVTDLFLIANRLRRAVDDEWCGLTVHVCEKDDPIWKKAAALIQKGVSK